MDEAELPGLAAVYRALEVGDDAAVRAGIQRLIAERPDIVASLERLVEAAAAGGNIAGTVGPLRVLERMLPGNAYILVRRLQAQIEIGIDDAAERLARSGPELAHDALLFHAVEFLAARGFLEEANALTEGPRAGGIGRGAIAACRARVLVARGRLRQALAVLRDVAAADDPHLVALRYRRAVQEALLDFSAVDEAGLEIALRSGQEPDLADAVERLLFTFDHERAHRLLQSVAERHPDRAAAVRRSSDRVGAAEAALKEAVREHGPIPGSNPSAIHLSLAQPGIPASRVLWGKAGLISFLGGSGMTEPEFDRFQWFLPNWEDARVRHRVLDAARRVCPEAVEVRARWLAHLMMLNAYADAAAECHAQLVDGVGGDTLFQAVVLLRLEKDGTVPSFMEPGLFDRLRSRLLLLVPRAVPGFTDVLHDHLIDLGWSPPSPAACGTPDDEIGALLRRRLLGTVTGRFGRRAADPGEGRTRDIPGTPVRPVVAISGQLRGFETAWASIRERVVQPLDAPVVVSVWDKSINATGRHAQRLERMLPEDVVARLLPEERYTDTFATAYPRTAAMLFGKTEVSAPAVKSVVDGTGCSLLDVETEDETAVESLLPKHVSGNMLKMYYKFARLEALLRQDEVRSGRTFSHVVWVRPDCEIVRLHPRDLQRCVSRPEIAWSSFVTENEFGDYLMILPRRAFGAIASVFSRVCLAGDTRLLPWRPARPIPGSRASALGAFGGPDVIFDTLLAAGFMPYNRIPRISVRLLGRTPGHDVVREMFNEEFRSRSSMS